MSTKWSKVFEAFVGWVILGGLNMFSSLVLIFVLILFVCWALSLVIDCVRLFSVLGIGSFATTR